MMATRTRARAADLHASDAHLWALSQADALRAGRLAELDLAHLAEEIEALAIGIKSAVRSRTRTIVEHLLNSSIRRRRIPDTAGDAHCAQRAASYVTI
jgi:Domain of unknown function DUF29